MNPYEHRARNRKAARIAEHAFASWSRIMAEYDAPLTHNALARFVIDLASAGSGMRLCYAVSAGCKKPSARTWLRVIDLVARKGAREIAGRKPAADPFAGLTEAEAA